MKQFGNRVGEGRNQGEIGGDWSEIFEVKGLRRDISGKHGE